MKIANITDEIITFDNGAMLTFEHDQDCCERVYADFEYLQIIPEIKDVEFSPPAETLTELIRVVDDLGFLLMGEKCRYADGSRRKYLVPCYNEQNGYYSDNLTLIYRNGDIEMKLDVSQSVQDFFD